MSEAAGRTTVPATDPARIRRAEAVTQAATPGPKLAEPDALMLTMSPERLLALQRLAGNQAVLRLHPVRGPATAPSVQRNGDAGAPSATAPPVDRVAQLNADYAAAVAAGNWIRTAELLNGYNTADIATRLAALTAAQRTQLMAGARQCTAIGDGARIIDPLRILMHGQPGRIFGTVTTTQTPHDAASARLRCSFEFRIVFTPDPSVVDSPQIAFVQTSRVVDTAGANAEFLEPQNSRRNARNEAIDRIADRKYGWYGFNDDQTTAGTITPGVAPGPPVVAARFDDEPATRLRSVSFNFETSIISRRGVQANLVYSVVHWGFDVDASGHVTAHAVTIEDRPTAGFATAVAAWNAQAAGPAAGRNAPDQQALPNFR